MLQSHISECQIHYSSRPRGQCLLTSSMNCSPSLAASVSAELTRSMKPGRHPLPTSETKCSSIRVGFPSPSVGAIGETQRLPSTYATSFRMSNGAVDRRRISNGTASLEYINCLCSIEPAAILDRTQAASYINDLALNKYGCK